MVDTTRRQRDSGVATPVEMMYLLVFSMLAVFFLGFLGRLHAAGVEVENAAQSAARAASMAPNPTAAKASVSDSLRRSPLRQRCVGGGRTVTTWTTSPAGTWQGGTVTVVVTCTVANESLAGIWVPGTRTIAMRDTQPVDRYQR